MRERADEFLGSSARGMFIGTFHLLGLRILRENLTDDIAVCDRRRQVDILEGLLRGRRKAERMVETISRFKGFIEEAQDLEARNCGKPTTTNSGDRGYMISMT